MQTKWTAVEKKQLWIFVAVAFGMPVLMGILMGISFYRGNDVSVFPNAQMYYPAAGVMIAVLLTWKKEGAHKVLYRLPGFDGSYGRMRCGQPV